MADGVIGASADILRIVSNIVAAYVSKNAVPAADLPAVILSVHATLTGLGEGGPADSRTLQKPAVPLKKSIMPSYIVCLEDGKKLTMLKRYLRSRYNLTPDEYRAKWGLPHDYPMVAPNYSQRRSEFAKKIGLGRAKASATRRRKRA